MSGEFCKEKEVEQNRATLIPIIETLILCCHKELLWGVMCKVILLVLKTLEKENKFRALLRFLANAGDGILKQHLSNDSKMPHT